MHPKKSPKEKDQREASVQKHPLILPGNSLKKGNFTSNHF